MGCEAMGGASRRRVASHLPIFSLFLLFLAFTIDPSQAKSHRHRPHQNSTEQPPIDQPPTIEQPPTHSNHEPPTSAPMTNSTPLSLGSNHPPIDYLLNTNLNLSMYTYDDDNDNPPYHRNSSSPCEIPNDGYRLLRSVGKKLEGHCEVVILSSTFNNYDRLSDIPERIIEQNKGVCFVYYSDTKLKELKFHTALCQPARGFESEGGLMCKGWLLIQGEPDDFPFSTESDVILNNRIHKTLLHLFFPTVPILGWIDGNKAPREGLSIKRIRNIFSDKRVLLASMKSLHDIQTIQDEFDYNARVNVSSTANIHPMFKMYKRLGWLKLPVFHGGFRLQRNHPKTSAFACDWFAEIEAWVRRDQLSLSPMMYKHGLGKPPALYLLNNTEENFFEVSRHHLSHRKFWAAQTKQDAKKEPTEPRKCRSLDLQHADEQFVNSSHFQRIKSFIEAGVPNIRFALDIGAGYGAFAAEAQRAWNLRVSSLATEDQFRCIVKKRGLQFGAVMWDKVKTPYPLLSEMYDLIHVNDFPLLPGPEMKRIAEEWARLLTPRGILIVSGTMSATGSAALVIGLESRRLRVSEMGEKKLNLGTENDSVNDWLFIFKGRNKLEELQ